MEDIYATPLWRERKTDSAAQPTLPWFGFTVTLRLSDQIYSVYKWKDVYLFPVSPKNSAWIISCSYVSINANNNTG